MSESVFVEGEFFLLIVMSVILPIGIFSFMLLKKAISRTKVLLFGIILLVISGINVLLLQHLASMARISPSLLDDHFFTSAISISLYLLPAIFAGIGINIVSHILISHLEDAERKYDSMATSKDRENE